MQYLNIIIPFIGGLGLFIYGMHTMAQGLEAAAGEKMKFLLKLLTNNKLTGVLLGTAVTAIIQSSSATTVMAVGFVNAGIMNLSQAMSVILGANIGTTVTSWLVASSDWTSVLSPEALAPVAVIVGVIIMLTGKKERTKDISSVITGAGILFIGIASMADGVAPLKNYEGFSELLISLGKNPLSGIIAGTLITAVIQSSSASIGILQSLARAGLVPFDAAVYIIMGENIGTCVTAILSSIGAKKNAKAAALMHLLINVIGTAFFGIVSVIFFKAVNPEWCHGSITQTQISAVHTLFNVLSTVLLYPVSDLIVKWSVQISNIETKKKKSVLRS